jgi:hypothetical protein
MPVVEEPRAPAVALAVALAAARDAYVRYSTRVSAQGKRPTPVLWYSPSSQGGNGSSAAAAAAVEQLLLNRPSWKILDTVWQSITAAPSKGSDEVAVVDAFRIREF